MKLKLIVLTLMMTLLGCERQAAAEFPITLGEDRPISLQLSLDDGLSVSAICEEVVTFKQFDYALSRGGRDLVSSRGLATPEQSACDAPGASVRSISTNVDDLVAVGQSADLRLQVQYDDGGYRVEQRLTRLEDGWAVGEATVMETSAAPPFTLAEGKAVYARIIPAVERGIVGWRVQAICSRDMNSILKIELSGYRGSDTGRGTLEPTADGETIACEAGDVLLSKFEAVESAEIGEQVGVGILVDTGEEFYEMTQGYIRTETGWEPGGVSETHGR